MKLTDDQLIRAIEQHEGNAETYGNLQEDRRDALDYYLGKPLGNEVPGRSQVIYRAVFDTVEWIKPQLADIFTSGEDVVSFTPRGPEDVEAAQQETDYINNVITERNPWFEIFLAWVHDALVQKVGYVKAYYDDSTDTVTERYSNLTDDEFALLMQDKDITIVEHEEQAVSYDPSGAWVEKTHTVAIERSKPENLVRIENLAPETVRVSQNARKLSLQDRRVDFVQHAEDKTISELREDGFDVPDDINDGGDGAGDWEEASRDDYTPFRDRDTEASEPSMRRVKVRETWIRFDKNGDGRAELLHCVVVGTTVLHCEETDHIPIVALCPTPLSHQHHGLSIADAVMDLQRIQTALLRGGLDNQYLANHGRYAVSDDVNLDDMLDSRPGGVVRVANGAQPGTSILPLTHPTNGQVTIPMMEYVDKISQRRTGVSEMSQGLNPNALNNQAGANANAQMMTAAQQRIRFIARVFAETGVRNLFQLVHMLSLKHSRQTEMVELRGQWVPVNPRSWVKRKDMTVTLTLGTGDKPTQILMLQQIGLAQEKGLQIGIATPANLYHTASQLTKLMGHRDVTKFWTDPATQPPKETPPDPKIMVEQMRQQADLMRFQAESQQTQALEQARLAADAQRAQMELETQAANDARDAERAQMQAQMDLQMRQYEADQAAALERYKAELADAREARQAELEMAKAKLDAETKVIVASMSAQQAQPVEADDDDEEEKPQVDHMAALGAALQAFQQAITRPRAVVRDADGRIIGVQ